MSTLGVLIPCRNEALVIERKLANLARAKWPPALRPHRLLVVDDGSEDATFELAQRIAARLFAGGEVEARCVRNAVRPGKNGALSQGLAELEREVELVVVTDADVLIDEWALVNLARAFEQDARLGMACGVQRFVPALRDDGSCEGPGGGPPGVASAAWDRLTAGVRLVESLFGRLFSVHGQLLAWRASLALRPSQGVAADDLDLMLTLRERHPKVRVARVAGALFYERKTPPGADADAQALRRARAYLQLFREHRSPPAGILSRMQWYAYRAAPVVILASMPVYWIALAAFVVVLARHSGVLAVLVLVVEILLEAFTGAGREWYCLARTIVRARRTEARAALPERWETARS